MSKNNQPDQVVAAVEKLGGLASLSQLNAEMADTVALWGTKTPFATIRRIMQTDKRLRKIKAGLYCLQEKQADFMEKYAEDSNDAKAQRPNHAYYQGLLLNIGEMENFKTYVPKGDRNHDFLQSGKLGEMANYPKLPEFGYPTIMKQAETVDVIWFNQRAMPNAFYEVEMTTDMGRSLEKFYELQDFHANFIIVAPSGRRDLFDRKINLAIHARMRSRIKFMTTESVVAKIHKIIQKATDMLIT